MPVEVSFEDPRARALLADFAADMDRRYPGGAPSTAAPDMFRPPGGTFLLVLDDGVPVACAGLRTLVPGVGEVKRMYVAPAARGRGLARGLLRALADRARTAGCTRLVLETGTEQPEAVALYESEGWQPLAPYGEHRDDPRCRSYQRDLR